MAEWISVKDKLPIDEGKVLIAYGEPFFGKETTELECAYYDEDSERFLFWLSDREVQGYGVHHWQKLPPNPEEIK